jgi:hypothetical protein
MAAGRGRARGGHVQHSTGKPTKSQQARFDALKEMGCICCWNHDAVRQDAEIHHIAQGFKRLGHDFTIPLCTWHHRGHPPAHLDVREMTQLCGPSLARGKRAFVAVFGTELALLETVNAVLYR